MWNILYVVEIFENILKDFQLKIEKKLKCDSLK